MRSLGSLAVQERLREEGRGRLRRGDEAKYGWERRTGRRPGAGERERGDDSASDRVGELRGRGRCWLLLLL